MNQMIILNLWIIEKIVKIIINESSILGISSFFPSITVDNESVIKISFIFILLLIELFSRKNGTGNRTPGVSLL